MRNLWFKSGTRSHAARWQFLPQVVPSEHFKCARSGLAGGYQIARNSGTCHRLSGDVRDPKNVKWFLLNPRDPAMGVALQYTGGSNCTGFDEAGNPIQVQRSLRLDFLCDARREGVPSQNITIVETNTCEYNMVFETAMGCPQECPEVRTMLGSAELCGDHGVCDYNTATGKAACFCNKDYSGADCTTKGGKGKAPQDAPDHAGAIVGTLFGCTALGAALAYAGVYYYNKKQGVDAPYTSGGAAENYAQLDGDGGAMFSGSSTAGGDNSGYVAPQA